MTITTAQTKAKSWLTVIHSDDHLESKLLPDGRLLVSLGDLDFLIDDLGRVFDYRVDAYVGPADLLGTVMADWERQHAGRNLKLEPEGSDDSD